MLTIPDLRIPFLTRTRLVCPHCFGRMRRRELLFRCVGRGQGRLAGCEPVLDEPLQQFHSLRGGGAGAVLPPVFAADGRRARAVHPACGQEALRRVCPHCHNELASDYCDVPSRMVALVGAINSGKSTYIAVFIRQLLNQVGRELNASLVACDDRTSRRYREDFAQRLFDRGELLPKTVSAANVLHDPLVYRLSLTRRWWRLRQRRALTLVLYDTAGEDLTSHDSVDQHLRYLGVADAVIFLVDPLELPGAQADLRPGAGPGGSGDTDDPLDVIRRVTQLLRAAYNRPAPRQLPVVVAVALTKVDALRETVGGEQSALLRNRPATGRLEVEDQEQVEEDVRSLLNKWHAGAVDRELAISYRAHALFGLSALGHPPKDGAVDPSGIAPYRVEDPLLWLLHQFRMIPASKPVRRNQE